MRRLLSRLRSKLVMADVPLDLVVGIFHVWTRAL